MVRKTSTKTYRKIHKDGTAARTTAIIKEYLAGVDAVTRRQIEEATRLRANQVTGRVNEMLKRGEIFETGAEVIDPVSGRPAHLVCSKRPPLCDKDGQYAFAID